jgi:hypothetical protein
MLQVFYRDVTYVLQCFFKCFLGAFASVFIHILQMLYLDVLKVDRALHIRTRVGSGRGHERSPAQSGIARGDVRGHADGDVLARVSAASGRRSTVWASVRTYGY